MEYSHRSRSNAICFSDFQRSLYMNDDSYDKDLYQFERDLLSQSYPMQGSTCNNSYKKSSQQSLATEENGLSSYCCLNDGMENDTNQNLPSKQNLESSQQLSIDNIRSADDLKTITDNFLKNLSLQDNKGMSETQIPTAKLIHH